VEITQEYLIKYVKELRMTGHPWFCYICPVIRNVSQDECTFLDPVGSMLFNNRGMCDKCFRYLAEHRDEEALENRLKLWEQNIGYSLHKNKEEKV